MDWFTVTSLAPGTWQISEPIGRLEPRFGVSTVNMWLVAGRTRAALVDSGMGIANLAATVRALTSLPVLVCNTHWHWDHCGGNHQFDQIAIHQTEYDLLQRDQQVNALREQMARPEVRALLPAGFDPDAYHIAGTRAAHTLCDTDKIDLGERILEVMHTPGHSPGHVAYWDSLNGMLFSGDTAYAGPMYACFDGSDPAAFARSARRLAGMANEVRCIAPGHNQALANNRFLEELADAAEAAFQSDPATLPRNEFIRGREFKQHNYSIFLPDPQPST